jgi:hypothetical protein
MYNKYNPKPQITRGAKNKRKKSSKHFFHNFHPRYFKNPHQKKKKKKPSPLSLQEGATTKKKKKQKQILAFIISSCSNNSKKQPLSFNPSDQNHSCHPTRTPPRLPSHSPRAQPALTVVAPQPP